MDGVRFNEEQTKLLEKILDKLLEVKEIVKGMQVNCKRMQQSCVELKQTLRDWQDDEEEENGPKDEDELVKERKEEAVEVENRFGERRRKKEKNKTHGHPQKSLTSQKPHHPQNSLASQIIHHPKKSQDQPSSGAKYLFDDAFLRSEMWAKFTADLQQPENLMGGELTFGMDGDTWWEFDPGGIYFRYLYFLFLQPIFGPMRDAQSHLHAYRATYVDFWIGSSRKGSSSPVVQQYMEEARSNSELGAHLMLRGGDYTSLNSIYMNQTVEGLHGFIQDESEHKRYLIVSVVTNLLVNLIGVWFFRNYARINLEDMNYHAVCLHFLADSISINLDNGACDYLLKAVRTEEHDEIGRGNPSTQKKQRVVCSVDLHVKFVAAVHGMGLHEFFRWIENIESVHGLVCKDIGDSAFWWRNTDDEGNVGEYAEKFKGKKFFAHYLFDILPLKVVFEPFDRGKEGNLVGIDCEALEVVEDEQKGAVDELCELTEPQSVDIDEGCEHETVKIGGFSGGMTKKFELQNGETIQNLEALMDYQAPYTFDVRDYQIIESDITNIFIEENDILMKPAEEVHNEPDGDEEVNLDGMSKGKDFEILNLEVEGNLEETLLKHFETELMLLRAVIRISVFSMILASLVLGFHFKHKET